MLQNNSEVKQFEGGQINSARTNTLPNESAIHQPLGAT
jgi:hypothetical protein